MKIIKHAIVSFWITNFNNILYMHLYYRHFNQLIYQILRKIWNCWKYIHFKGYNQTKLTFYRKSNLKKVNFITKMPKGFFLCTRLNDEKFNISIVFLLILCNRLISDLQLQKPYLQFQNYHTHNNRYLFEIGIIPAFDALRQSFEA